MIDHTGVAVGDLARARRFCEVTLAMLGITLLADVTPERSGGGRHAGSAVRQEPA